MKIGYMSAGATTVLLPAIIEEDFSEFNIEKLFSDGAFGDSSFESKNTPQQKESDSPLPSPETIETKTSKAILLIDDDKLILMTLKRLLAKEGYKVTTAMGGTIALKRIKEADFDLIISDLKMPQMNGIETVRAIREYLAKNNKKPTPEIFISAYAKEEIYQEAVKLNAAAYIEKPFDVKALLQAVRKIIRNELV